MKNDKIHIINIANKYSINPQIIEEIFELMDNWFKEKLTKEISHYKEVEEWLSSMRDPTPEERDSINNYIESISRPTGVNIFDIMDEYENDNT